VLGDNAQKLTPLIGQVVGFYTGYNKEVAQYLLIGQLVYSWACSD